MCDYSKAAGIPFFRNQFPYVIQESTSIHDTCFSVNDLWEKGSLSPACLVPAFSNKDTRLCAAFANSSLSRIVTSYPCLRSRFYTYTQKSPAVGVMIPAAGAHRALCTCDPSASWWHTCHCEETAVQGGQCNQCAVEPAAELGSARRPAPPRLSQLRLTGLALFSFLTSYFAP